MKGKPQLLWPTLAEEMEASAERRRLQRDREARANSRNSASANSSLNSNPTTPKQQSPAKAKPTKPVVKTASSKNQASKQQTTKETKSSDSARKRKHTDEGGTTSANLGSGNKGAKKTSPDENKPPPLKQKTLTFYFERKQRPSEVLNPDAVTPTTSAVIKRLPESATQSPTPIRAKPNISRAQIVSPDAAKNGKDKEVYEIKQCTVLVKKQKPVGEPHANEKTAAAATEKTAKKPCWRTLDEPKPTKEQEPKPTEEELAQARAEQDRKRVERISKKLKKALKNLDKDTFSRELKSAVHLSEELIATIANPFVRYVVGKEAAQHRLDSTMKTMTVEERKTFRREFREQRANLDNFYFDQLLELFMGGKYDDQVVLEKMRKAAIAEENEDTNTKEERYQKFCELTPLFEDRPELGRLYFGRALAISQFLYVHRKFLKWTFNVRRVSAVDLVRAIDQGPIGNVLVSAVLAVLANFLAEKCRVKLKTKIIETEQRSLRSRPIKTITKEEPTILDTVRRLLADVRGKKNGSKRENSEEAKDGDNEDGEESDGEEDTSFDGLSEALDELDNASEFFHLSMESQFLILEQFIQRITSLDQFHAYIDDDGKNELAEALQRQAEFQEAKTNLQTELAKLEAEQIRVDDLSLLTRGQSSEMQKNERNIREKRRELESIGQQLAETAKNCRFLKFTNKCRTTPLGQDRFMRTYWFFGDTPNGNAIFACPNSKCPYMAETNGKQENANSPENANVEEEFIQRFYEQVAGRQCPGHKEERWWSINTLDDFVQLQECLLGRGVRESQLRRNLAELRDLIEPRLTRKKPAMREEAKNEEEEVEESNEADQEEEADKEENDNN